MIEHELSRLDAQRMAELGAKLVTGEYSFDQLYLSEQQLIVFALAGSQAIYTGNFFADDFKKLFRATSEELSRIIRDYLQMQSDDYKMFVDDLDTIECATKRIRKG